MNRTYFDHAEADSLSEGFAATTSTRLVRVTAGNGQILGDRQSEGSTQPARPRHGCNRAWFEIEPQRAPGPMGLLESADRSRVGVGGKQAAVEKRKGTKRRAYVLLGTNGKDRGTQFEGIAEGVPIRIES